MYRCCAYLHIACSLLNEKNLYSLTKQLYVRVAMAVVVQIVAKCAEFYEKNTMVEQMIANMSRYTTVFRV